jgi:hypothetical protein
MHVPAFSLRLATPRDAADLSAFAARVFRETFGKDNTVDDMDAYIRGAFSAELQAQEIAEPGAVVLLALAPAGQSDSGSSVRTVENDQRPRHCVLSQARIPRGRQPSVPARE